MEQGLLIFNIFIPPEDTEKDNFIPGRICFTCYALEDHFTPQCPHKDLKICSECSQQGHRWNECRSTKKSINCKGNHRTLAMACPIKKKKYNAIKNTQQLMQTRATNKKYNEIDKEAIKEI